MISRAFWQVLQQPQRRHPLFQLAYTQQPIDQLHLPTNAVLAIVLTLTFAVFISREFSSLLSILVLFTIPLSAAQFVFSGTINGFRWALQTSQMLADLRRHRQYDLLALTPAGPMGVNLAIGTGILYKSLGTLNRQANWPARVLLSLPLAVFLGFQNTESRQPILPALSTGLHLLLIVLWFYSEDTQSLVLGGLTGMFAASTARTRFDLLIAAIGIFLGSQLLAYLSAIVLALVALPLLYHAIGFHGWFAALTYLAGGLVCLYFAREGAIWFLWRQLARRLQIETNFNSAFSPTAVYNR